LPAAAQGATEVVEYWVKNVSVENRKPSDRIAGHGAAVSRGATPARSGPRQQQRARSEHEMGGRQQCFDVHLDADAYARACPHAAEKKTRTPIRLRS